VLPTVIRTAYGLAPSLPPHRAALKVTPQKIYTGYFVESSMSAVLVAALLDSSPNDASGGKRTWRDRAVDDANDPKRSSEGKLGGGLRSKTPVDNGNLVREAAHARSPLLVRVENVISRSDYRMALALSPEYWTVFG